MSKNNNVESAPWLQCYKESFVSRLCAQWQWKAIEDKQESRITHQRYKCPLGTAVCVYMCVLGMFTRAFSHYSYHQCSWDTRFRWSVCCTFTCDHSIWAHFWSQTRSEPTRIRVWVWKGASKASQKLEVWWGEVDIMRCVKLQVLRNNSGSVEWMLTLNYGMRVIVARGMFSYKHFNAPDVCHAT